MVVLGVGTWALEAGTAVPYFVALALMTAAGLSAVQWVPILVAYVVIMIIPGIIVAVGWVLTGENLRPRLERWRIRLSEGSRTMVSWIVGIAGLFVVYDAARRLLLEYDVQWLQLGRQMLGDLAHGRSIDEGSGTVAEVAARRSLGEEALVDASK